MPFRSETRGPVGSGRANAGEAPRGRQRSVRYPQSRARLPVLARRQRHLLPGGQAVPALPLLPLRVFAVRVDEGDAPATEGGVRVVAVRRAGPAAGRLRRAVQGQDGLPVQGQALQV